MPKFNRPASEGNTAVGGEGSLRHRTLSLFVGEKNLFFLRIDDEDGEKLCGLGRAGVGTHLVMIARHFGPTFSGLERSFRPVVDLAADRAFQHGCVDERG